MTKNRGQIELIALAGVALLILGVVAYFMFFKAAPGYQKPLITVTAPKKAVCVNGAADVKLTVVNPANNPPMAITVNAKADDATLAAVLDGAPVKLPFTAVIAPGDFMDLSIYVSPHTAGKHVVTITVSYLLSGMEKPVTETYKVTINAVNCG